MVLANNSRPKTFDEMVGQTHLLSSNGILTNALRMTPLPSLIFYGPPGTGKTTASEIIAAQSNMPLIKMNATQASITNLRNKPCCILTKYNISTKNNSSRCCPSLKTIR